MSIHRDKVLEAEIRGDKTSERRSLGAPEFSSREAFEKILDLHRKRSPVREVYFLERICFPLEQTQDPFGLRHVLWGPLANFLEFGFQIDVIDRMCDGHIILAYLEHGAAAIAQKLTPLIERECTKQPLFMESSGPQVMVSVAGIVSGDLETRPEFAEKIDRMREAYKAAVRQGQYFGLPALRAQLSELALSATEPELRRCIELMEAGKGEGNWPPNSAALASERSLARDWLTPEEDVAWSHL